MPLILRSHKQHIKPSRLTRAPGTKIHFSPYPEEIRPLKENFYEKGRKEFQTTEYDLYTDSSGENSFGIQEYLGRGRP